MNKEDLKTVTVPLFSDKDHKHIGDLARKALRLCSDSQSLCTQAQQLLEQELGLDKLAFEKPVGYEVSFNEVISGRRIDSQCYKPDFINYEKYLRQNSDFDYLRILLKSSIKGKQMPISTSGSINYASIKDIHGLELITDSCCNIPTDIRIAERDSLLLAITGATIGKIGIVNRYDQLAFSGDLLGLNLNENIDPHYLLTVMQSPIGQSQCNRWITGSTNGHLAPKDVMKIVIPRLKGQKEETISDKVKESLQARFESEKLLEKAKTCVEQLIEQAAEKS